MNLSALVTIQNVVTLLGLIGGIYTVFQIYGRITQLYNDLLYRDKIFENKLDQQRERLGRLDQDLETANNEHRQARARIWDRVSTLELRYSKENWQFLVTQGYLTQKQLDQLRSQLGDTS